MLHISNVPSLTLSDQEALVDQGLEKRKKSLPLHQNQRKSAFGSTCVTVKERSIQNSPGPGQYQINYDIGSLNKCGSMSLRGCTPLISLDPRFNNDIQELRCSLEPGPGSYTPQTSAIIKSSGPKGISFGKRPSTSPNRKITPGPDHYNVSTHSIAKGKIQNLGAASFRFTSRKNSDMLLPKHNDTNLAVGMYDVAKTYDFLDHLGKDKRKGKDFPDPTFSSTSTRFALDGKDASLPAPGYYYNECDRMAYNDEMYRPSACFVSGLDRSGKSRHVEAVEDPLPGPGSYITDNRSDDQIRYRHLEQSASACFASMSSRFSSNNSCEKEDGVPGPQSYSPKLAKQKSFHQNRYQRWV